MRPAASETIPMTASTPMDLFTKTFTSGSRTRNWCDYIVGRYIWLGGRARIVRARPKRRLNLAEHAEHASALESCSFGDLEKNSVPNPTSGPTSVRLIR